MLLEVEADYGGPVGLNADFGGRALGTYIDIENRYNKPPGIKLTWLA